MSAQPTLEQRVAAIEQQLELIAGDQLSPNYLTVDPATGKIGANFSGHVAAQGVDLPEGNLISPAELPHPGQVNALDWKDVAGVVRELLVGGPTGTAGHELQIWVGDGPTFTNQPVGYANLALSASPDGTTLPAAHASVRNGNLATAKTATLLDGNLKSSFIQTPALTPEQLALVGGLLGPLAFPAATYQFIPHGLGRTPIFAIVTPVGWPAGDVTMGVSDATNIAFATDNAAPGGDYVYWLALG